MGWVRLDSAHGDHPKLIEAGVLAELLDIRAICWSARFETDGRVPRAQLRVISRGISRPAVVANRLVEAGRWRVASRRDGFDGWIIHDYLKLNQSKAEREAEREAARIRQRKSRARSNGVTHDVSSP